MTLLQWLKDAPERLVLHGFRTRNFIALLGVKDAVGLAPLLEQDDAEQPYRDVYGLHNLRWVLFTPQRKNGSVAPVDGAEAQALVLSLIFDGNLRDILPALLARAGERVRAILAHCIGFGPGVDVIRYLQARETPSRYLFRDLGPLVVGDPKLLPWQRPHFAPEPDATRYEIEEARAAQLRFEQLYARHAGAPAAELRRAFCETFGGDAFPLPLTRFERQRSDEASWTRRMVDVSRKLQERTERRLGDGQVRRGAHAKAHGLIHASFEVLPVEKHLRLGLFSQPGRYPALLRPSNGSSDVQADHVRAPRGLSLRVQLPPDLRLAGRVPEPVLPGPIPTAQDFVLMNQPVFVAPDVRRFAMWFKNADLQEPLPVALGALGMLATPGGLREAALLLRTITTRLSHPLATTFHSVTPYLLGSSQVVKYCVEPLEPERLAGDDNPADPDALQASLRASLKRGSIVLRFSLYVLRVDTTPAGLSSVVDAVEDATVDIRRLGARKVHVANIHIGPQDPASAELLQAAEELQFNPWNALVEHRPLGSLNRARLVAYRASQHLRRAAQAANTVARAAE